MMPVDLDDQLTALGAALLRDSAPITVDELALDDVMVRLSHGRTRRVPTRRRWATVAAVITAAAAVVGIVAVVNRGGESEQATVPEPEQQYVEGVLDVDPGSAVADGWEVQVEPDALDGGWGEIVTRRYAIESPRPETGPALDVATFQDGPVLPNIPQDELAFDLGGVDAWWLDAGQSARGLAFLVDGRWFVVRGYRLTDEQIVTAAEHVRFLSDDSGAIVDDEGLPEVLAEQFVSGGMSEIWLLPAGLAGDEVKEVRWADGERAVWLQGVPADDTFVVASRTAASAVTEVAVGDHPSFVATWDGQPDLRWMAWTQDGWSYLLSGYLVSSDELVAFANALAPMPAERWTELVNASRPDDEIPIGVLKFPAIRDGAALDGAARGMYGVWAGPAGEVAYPIIEVRSASPTVSPTRVSVRPVSINEVTATWTDMTGTAISGRDAATGSSESGQVVAIDLGGGETLVVEGSERPLDELIALAEAVELVDQATWDDRYEAIHPYVTDEGADATVPVTTTAEAVVDRGTLHRGMSGDDVAALQARLIALGFDPGPVDGVFGQATEQAVWAFEKMVLGVPREQATGVVTPETWERMLGPVAVTPRRPQDDGVDHVEIYLPEQVLVVFHDDQPVLVTHVSTGELDDTGAPAEYCETITIDTDSVGNPLPTPEERSVCGIAKTPGGIFDVDRFVPGRRIGPLGGMWNPIYFNELIAIHGAVNVPLVPASHGNVRVPMHVSERLPDLIPVGTQVFVWDGEKEPEDQTGEDELPVFESSDPVAATP